MGHGSRASLRVESDHAHNFDVAMLAVPPAAGPARAVTTIGRVLVGVRLGELKAGKDSGSSVSEAEREDLRERVGVVWGCVVEDPGGAAGLESTERL